MQKLVSAILAIVIAAALLTPCTGAADRTGYTPISTPDDLLKMKDSYSKFYLTNDINMKNYGNWKSYNFYGTLDGNGYAIKNLTSNYGGLFLNLGDTSASTVVTIKNLGLYNVNVSNHYSVGALANYYKSYSFINIENCYVTGKVVCTGSHNYSAAGFIAANNGYGKNKLIIKNCLNKAAVTSNGFAGGIIGEPCGYTSFTLINCVNSGNITGGDRYAGGIAGNADDVSMTSCYNYGTVDIGGFVGVATSKTRMKNCATTSSVDIGYKDGDVSATCKTGLAKSAFKKQATYKNFDFKEVWLIKKDVNGGYPILRTMEKLYK